MKKILLFLSFVLSTGVIAMAQVAISNDGTMADANAMLDIKSNNKGVKFPRLTSAERKAIPVTAADAGLMVFDKDKQALYMYDGTEWLFFAASSNSLSLFKKKMPLTSPKANFGQSCAVSGNYAVIGASNDTVGLKQYAGSAYTYQKLNGNWVQQNRLIADDAIANAGFGYEVAIDGDYLAAGASKAPNGANINSGAVYIFKRDGDNWVQQAKLVPSDAGANYYFGQSIEMQGDVIVIGARGCKVGNNMNQGAAYVFSRFGDVWLQQTRIIAPDGVAEGYFGNSVAIHNNEIVVGVVNGLVGGIKAGTAYVFTKSGNSWVFTIKLSTSNPVAGGGFGSSVSISDEFIAVGAPNEVPGTIKTGRFYLYKKINNAWVFSYWDPPLTSVDNLVFGSEVIVRDDFLLVSAMYETVGNSERQGRIYVYKKNAGSGFDLFKIISDPEGLPYDGFGYSLAFDGSTFITGLPNKQRNAGIFSLGLVYFGSVD